MMTPRKPWWRRWFGSRSERAAARFLRGLGMRIVAWNWTCPGGELDLVAVEGGRTIVFVEVRSTESGDLDKVAASVDHEKQRKLTDTALAFLRKRRLLNYPARFDVLLIRWPAGAREPVIVHHRQAFEAVGRGQMYS